MSENKFINNARSLRVFQISFESSVVLHETSLEFPKFEQFELASQLRRASKSVCSNLVEGFAKQSSSKKEFARFLSMSLGSAKETQLWLDYSLRFKYISKEFYQRYFEEYEKIFAMLSKLKSKL